jgi:hypothetical protein
MRKYHHLGIPAVSTPINDWHFGFKDLAELGK